MLVDRMDSAKIYILLLMAGQVVSLENQTDSHCSLLEHNCFNFQCDKICQEDSRFACKEFCNCKIDNKDLTVLGNICKDNCSYNRDSCQLECKPGYHGLHCSLQCNTGCRKGLCHQHSGDCKGCENGKFGETCLDQCNRNCLYSLCEQLSGVCMFGCQHGFYGTRCTDECPGCYVCTRDTGECLIEDGPIYYRNIIIISSSIGAVCVIILSSVLFYRCCRSNKNKRSRACYRRSIRPRMDLPCVTHGHSADPHYDIVMERLASLKCKDMTTYEERTERSIAGVNAGQYRRQARQRFRKDENLPSCWVGGQGIFELFDTTPECAVTGNRGRPVITSTEKDDASAVHTIEGDVTIGNTVISTVFKDNTIPNDDEFNDTKTNTIQECSNLRTSGNTNISIYDNQQESHTAASQKEDKEDYGSQNSCVRRGYISAVFDQSESLAVRDHMTEYHLGL